MTAQGKVRLGLALWLLATAHVTVVLILPFTGTSMGEEAWRLLLAPAALTALNAGYGSYFAASESRFWTRRRLAGASMTVIAATFAVTTAVLWPAEADMLAEDARTGILFLVTIFVMGPLGLSGLVLLITARKGGKRAKKPEAE